MAATTARPTAAERRRHIAVIPCRWGASRFPGKPLALLGGKPLLWHVHQRCLEAKRLDGAIVATDDERIEAACRELGIDCIRTGEHLTGTDRVAEVAERLPADGYINVQGDEPFISPTAINDVSEALEYSPPDTFAVNAYTELVDVGAVLDHSRPRSARRNMTSGAATRGRSRKRTRSRSRRSTNSARTSPPTYVSMTSCPRSSTTATPTWRCSRSSCACWRRSSPSPPGLPT
ncbi:NTP transferase domain-containing protein [Streptomyces sp. JJ36]|uniref:cytidylyltransferase domain-containing protein n=1 Tax=Streptomyces sp. JJ36 TaxID=2736645 RepID=UPI001F42074B|nr:NTP transferase domain-containing protein [Streptomyces sp. JJ36]